MPRGRRKGPNQSQFIRDLLGANPKATLGDAKKAWTEAGNKGTIGNSLFYIVKTKLGLTKPSARRGRRPGRPSASKAAARNGTQAYEAVEARLDEVIGMLWALGDHGLVADFRLARRKIAAKLA